MKSSMNPELFLYLAPVSHFPTHLFLAPRQVLQPRQGGQRKQCGAAIPPRGTVLVGQFRWAIRRKKCRKVFWKEKRNASVLNSESSPVQRQYKKTSFVIRKQFGVYRFQLMSWMLNIEKCAVNLEKHRTKFKKAEWVRGILLFNLRSSMIKT